MSDEVLQQGRHLDGTHQTQATDRDRCSDKNSQRNLVKYNSIHIQRTNVNRQQTNVNHRQTNVNRQ